mgnify:FL=1
MGYLLEKTWLLIFNYKKNNKNYIDLNVNDYLLYETNLIIKNNSINFNIFNINCYIYMDIYIDNNRYILHINKTNITLLKKIILFDNKIKLNNTIQELLKDMSNLEVNISLHKNTIKITGNDIILLEYNFEYNVNNLTYAIIYSLSKENKFVDINL